MRKRLAVLSCIIILITGGCAMNQYEPYEGLNLPTQGQKDQFNETPDSMPVPGWNHGIFPDNYDRSMAKEKGLCEDERFNDKFFYIQALYRKGLEQMLLEKLDLARYDRKIEEIVKYHAPSDNDDYYHSLSMINLDYISLRNNIYVERLEFEDLAVFESTFEKQETEITNEMQLVIERTWKSIICAYSDEDAAWYSNTPGMEAPSDAIVFMVRAAEVFDEYTDDGHATREAWKKIDVEEEYMENEFIPKMEKELSQKADVPVTVFSLWY